MVYTTHDYKLDGTKKYFRTLALLCEDDSLSDAQLNVYQTRFQEYRTFLENVSRLASCGNVCVTEESVMIGENGLLNGESLNALQHAGSISVYNTIQQNNWEFPPQEDGDYALIKKWEEKDGEPAKEDSVAVHISDCFIEGERARLHGSAKAIKSFLPPTIFFKNVLDEEPENDENQNTNGEEEHLETASPVENVDDGIKIVNLDERGLVVKSVPREANSNIEYLDIEDYFYGVSQPSAEYVEEKAEFRFKCAVCQRMFTSNIHLMHHIMEHVDDNSVAMLCFRDELFCEKCQIEFHSAYDLRLHNDRVHPIYIGPNGEPYRPPVFEGDPGSELVPMIRNGCNSVSAQFICKICSKEFPTELSLAHHLQFTHRFQEQPYVCRLCMFRSSVYEDILEHFYKFHRNSIHLMCPYCLRIFTPSDARPAGWSPPQATLSGGVSIVGLGTGVGQTQVLLQHLRLHQVAHHVRRCTCCKLNFTSKSDYQLHCRLDHKSVIPGKEISLAQAKKERRHGVTLIGTSSSSGNLNQAGVLTTGGSDKVVEIQTADVIDSEDAQMLIQQGIVPPGHELALIEGDEEGTLIILRQSTVTEEDGYYQMATEEDAAALNAVARAELQKMKQQGGSNRRVPVAMLDQSETEETLISNKSGALKHSLEGVESVKNTAKKSKPDGKMRTALNCLECDAFLDDMNHRRYLPCSACRFATCCAAAFNRHVESVHLSAGVTGKSFAGTKSPASSKQNKVLKGNPFTRHLTFKWMKRLHGDTKEEADKLAEGNAVPDLVYDPRKFHCMSCGLAGMDGNTLARHLEETCNVTTATLKPPKELLSSAVAATVAQQQPNTISMQTLGVLLPGQTVELTNEEGEVFQKLSWPQDLQLEKGQIVVIVHGDDGNTQLAIVPEESYDPTTNHVILPTDEEPITDGNF